MTTNPRGTQTVSDTARRYTLFILVVAYTVNFVDRSIVEVFVNGRQCAAVRVYPGREDSVGVSLRAVGKAATLKSLDAWQMKSIYKDH